MADRHDFEFDWTDVQAVARGQRGIGERLVVQQGVGRPATDDRSSGAAKDQAMERRHATRPETQSAMLAGTDGAFGRFQPHDLAVACGIADAENQIPGGDV